MIWVNDVPARNASVCLIKIVKLELFPADQRFSLSRFELLWKSSSLPERWNLYEY